MFYLKQFLVFYIALIFNFNSFGQVNKVRMIEQNSGAYTVGCSVNGINMNFIFDTGASLCSIGLTEALFLLKNGNITRDDFRNKIEFSIADGSKIIGQVINIRELKIGTKIFEDVETIIVADLDAPLLLGQNILSSHSAVLIDYNDYSVSFYTPFDYNLLQKSIRQGSSNQGLEEKLNKEIELAQFLQKKLEELTVSNSKLKGQLNDNYKKSQDLMIELNLVRSDFQKMKSNEVEWNAKEQYYLSLLKSGLYTPPSWDLNMLLTKINQSGRWRRLERGKTFYVTYTAQSPLRWIDAKAKYKVLEKSMLLDGKYFNIIQFKDHGIMYEAL